MQSILAAYGDLAPWFYYAPRFIVFAIIATLLGIVIGWFIWGKRGDSAEHLEEENDKLLREYDRLQKDYDKAKS